MKSMTGIRRLWSDYGMEGLYRKENLTRGAHFVLYSASACVFTFSLLVWSLRFRNHGVYTNLVNSLRQIRAVPLEPSLANELLEQVTEAIYESGITSDDLRKAASHWKPVDSELLELRRTLRVLSQTNNISHTITECCDPVLKALCTTLHGKGPSVPEFRKQLPGMLVRSWIDRKFFEFDSFPKRSAFGNRETSEAIGVDIGCKVGSVLSPSPRGGNFLGLESTLSAVRLLEQWGFVIVQAALPHDYVVHLRERFKLSQGPASENGERVKCLDPNISHSRAMVNRLNLIIRGSKLEDDLSDIHSVFVRLLRTVHSRVDLSGTSLMVSDMRLIVVDEAADKTNWTVYNPRGGYTVLIPLHDRGNRMGTQEVIGGSHFLTNPLLNIFKRVSWTGQRLLSVSFPFHITDIFLDGCWRAGDALVLDNRLLVRADENRVFKSGTYILIKYETPEAAAGGFFLAGKLVFRLAELFQRVAMWSAPRN